MTSSETGAAQPPPPDDPALPSPPLLPPHQHDAVDDASFCLPSSSDPDDAACRATRSSFPLSHQFQNGEDGMETANVIEPAHAMEIANGVEVANYTASEKHFRGGAWKDEWVVSLIHIRGSMEEEFAKPQKPGMDMWSRVSSQLAQAHEDFDKNSESCRKKWQRVYKAFKDDRTLLDSQGTSRQLSFKWFNLVDHYMHAHTDHNGSSEDRASLEEMAHVDPILTTHTGTGDNSLHPDRVVAKRLRKNQKVKESLSHMVETWRDSLEVLKDSEAKRLEILQTLSGTMASLLDVLRK